MLHVICAHETALTGALLSRAMACDIECVIVTPERLLQAAYTLSPQGLSFEGREVRTVLFLHGVQFPLEPFFEEFDREFAEAEIRAFFSVVRALPSVTCFNGLDAVQWFSRPGLEYFDTKELEVARSGERFWLPFRGVHPSALVDLPESAFPVARLASNAVTSVPFVFGKFLNKTPLPPPVGARLSELGIDFGWLLLSADEKPVAVSPIIDDPSLTDGASAVEALLGTILTVSGT